MAYPTGVAFKPTSQTMGLQPIHETSTVQNHVLGTIARAFDTNYGVGEFIYLAGVASTAQGDVCCYNSKTGATVRSVIGGTGASGPCGVAMSANVASQYGWYQISGSTPVKSSTVLAHGECYMTATAGQIDDAVSADAKVVGMTFRAADSAGYAVAQLARPCVVADATSASVTTLTAAAAAAQATADAAIPKASVLKLTLSAAAEAAQAIVVTGVVEDMAGLDAATAKQVMVRTLAVTADKGDITVTTGTSKKVFSPTTGVNEAWIETTAAGAFAFSVANDAVEDTLVQVTTTTGVTETLKLTFT
jgi:hypothetical protein